MDNFGAMRNTETAIIPKGTVINGNIAIEGKLEMYGVVNGDINSDSRVNVSGDITGNIKAMISTRRIPSSWGRSSVRRVPRYAIIRLSSATSGRRTLW